MHDLNVGRCAWATQEGLWLLVPLWREWSLLRVTLTTENLKNV